LAAPAIRKALGMKIRGYRITGRLASPIRTEGRHQLLAVGVSGDLVYPVDKGSGSITSLSQADGVVEIPSSIEYLERCQAVEVQLFGELVKPDLIIAGENCPFMEMLAESLPLQIKFISNGSKRGTFSVEDKLADFACVSGAEEICIPNGLVMVRGYTRELGLMAKDLSIMESGRQDLSIVGWSRDSEMSGLAQKELKNIGFDLEEVRLVGRARSHSVVAAAIASGRAFLGFGARMAASKAGLEFKRLTENRIDFFVAVSSLKKEGVQALFSTLKSEELKRRLPPGISIDENAAL
jgi:putative molybdopterin biosynthesis protein